MKSEVKRMPGADVLWILGFVGFYFAMQLWILPAMGVKT